MLLVVILLSGVMDRLVFRPLRTQSPAVMLVTTFAVAFILQNVALLIDVRDDTIGEPAAWSRRSTGRSPSGASRCER